MGIAKPVAIALVSAVLLAACGFQLRGTAALPFETLYMPNTTGGIALDLKRSIQAGTRTTVVDDPKKAAAVLEFVEEVREKHILSLAATGRVREFQLRYRVGFRVHDGKGGEFLPVSTVQLTREVSFNDSVVLAKETEEQLLYRDMQFDMVQQIMRRIAAAQRPKPAAQ
ncbi:MAG: LPS assembly lipoprotein LptE [Pseudomonadota bacterium]